MYDVVYETDNNIQRKRADNERQYLMKFMYSIKRNELYIKRESQVHIKLIDKRWLLYVFVIRYT